MELELSEHKLQEVCLVLTFDSHDFKCLKSHQFLVLTVFVEDFESLEQRSLPATLVQNCVVSPGVEESGEILLVGAPSCHSVHFHHHILTLDFVLPSEEGFHLLPGLLLRDEPQKLSKTSFLSLCGSHPDIKGVSPLSTDQLLDASRLLLQ